jgi:hypothetical protein
MRGTFLTVLVVTAGVRIGDARADPESRASIDRARLRRFELGMGPQLGFSSGLLCSGGGDVEGCSDGAGWVGVDVAPGIRFGNVRLGLRGVLDVTDMSEGQVRQWSTTAEARYYVIASSAVEPWLAIEAGWTWLDPSGFSKTAAPAAGAGAGVDFVGTDWFAFTLEGRALACFFDRQGFTGAPHVYFRGTQVVWQLAVGPSFRTW